MKLITTILILLVSGLYNPALADRNDSIKAINQAQVLLESAERSGAQKQAPVLLKSARDRLAQAQMKHDDRKWVDAEILAKMSQRDAEVADAKSLSKKAESSYLDLKAAVELLRSELERKRGMQ